MNWVRFVKLRQEARGNRDEEVDGIGFVSRILAVGQGGIGFVSRILGMGKSARRQRYGDWLCFAL